MSEPIADQAQRDAALDVRRSFIVQAPAGSGKTELLVRRFLNLLSSVEKPEEILAITFTRKAAAEMRKRVLAKLPELGLAAGDVAHRLRIQTIDALCVSLTRNMPVLARFGAQPGIVEDAGELYLEAASRTLRELSPPVERLLAHLDNDVGFATRLVANLLSQRDRWLRRTGQAPTRTELEAALLSERKRLTDRAKALYPDSSQELARLFLTKDLEWRKKPAAPPQAVAIPGLLEALQALYNAPPAQYSEERWQALEAILALLNPAVAQLKVVFAERNECDFTEFAHGALRALGAADGPSDLLLQLDQRISHILVDEFQDTSTSQWQLLEMLTAGWTGSDEVGDSGRTLFLVGDPMQSIYRFREAEVSLFLQAKHAGLGAVELTPLTLRTNFRSQANLVAWFNESFARVLPAEEDEASGAIPYAPAAPRHPPLDGPAAQWHGFYDRVAEAQKVVDLVRQAAGSKAILVRNRAHLDEIVPALKDAGLRFKAVEIEQLGEKQVVQDLFALTRALTHLGDRVAALAILRAPWCGLSLSDLHLLAGTDRHPRESGDPVSPTAKGGSEPQANGGFLVSDLLRDVKHLSPDGQLRISRLLAVLDPLWRNRQRGSLRDAVEGAWLALGGPACVANATELEDAEIFLDELESLEEAGAVDLAKLAERMQKLYALPDVEAPADAVEIMTIHKAKGLEFDTVIVPGLDRIPRAGPRPLFAWKSVSVRPPVKGGSEPSASGGLLLAPIDAPNGEGDEIYKYIRSLDRDADDIESGRLFYVAATRARQRLHLLACTKCDDDNTPKEPFKRSLLQKIWWQAREHFGPAPADDLEEEERPPLPDFLRRLPADFKVPSTPDSTAWKTAGEGREEAQIEFSWAGETARHVGTIVHRWLQRIADDQLHGWTPARVDALGVRFIAELRRRGVISSETKASAELIRAALRNTLTDERGRWLLSPHPEARSELRLRVHGEHGARHFIMDRVFRDDSGVWIVDFKTSRHEGANVEAFLDRERDRYTLQLSAYGDLMPGSRQALYFPLLKGWRERS